MQGEENGATTESKKTLWVMLEDPQHVLRSVDFVVRPNNTFEPVNQFKNRTISLLQHEWNGKLLFRCRLEDHPDYQCPKKEPLRWVEKCKPDKPGIWARQTDDGFVAAACWYAIDIEECETSATRCYLGPIPEILPPKKKVVQRLWIRHAKQTAQDAAEYVQQWVPCDEQLIGEGDWIRTDRTREVEQ